MKKNRIKLVIVAFSFALFVISLSNLPVLAQETGEGEGEGYKLETEVCNYNGGSGNGCKYICPSGDDPSCTLHVCQSW